MRTLDTTPVANVSPMQMSDDTTTDVEDEVFARPPE